MPTWTPSGIPDELADAVVETFRARHGRSPDAVSVAPGRVNVIGEHLDYNGGRVLPIALPHATYVASGRRPDDVVTILSGDAFFSGALADLGPGRPQGWAAYAAGVPWALALAGLPIPGMDLVVSSTVPVGAGLSSSAAVELAVALSFAPDEDPWRLVHGCIRAEREVAGAPTGGMDQTVSMFATAGHALLIDTRDDSITQVPWTTPGHALLVVDTRARHALVDGGYAARRADCEEAARLLRVSLLRDVDDPLDALTRLEGRVRSRARHVFTEMQRVEDATRQLSVGDLRALGETLTASHASMRDDFEISCPELDMVVETALAQGALGARMTGGGFGGSALALVPEAAVDTVAVAVDDAFARQGWPAPGLLLTVPSGGARRVR